MQTTLKKIVTSQFPEQVAWLIQRHVGQRKFRSAERTTDHIQVIQQLMRTCNEYKMSYFTAFVEHEKSLDILRSSSVISTLNGQKLLHEETP